MKFLYANEKIFFSFPFLHAKLCFASFHFGNPHRFSQWQQESSGIIFLFLYLKEKLSTCEQTLLGPVLVVLSVLFWRPISTERWKRKECIDPECLAWGNFAALLPSLSTVILLPTLLSASWKCAGPKWTFSGNLFLPWIDNEHLKRKNIPLCFCNWNLPPLGECWVRDKVWSVHLKRTQ